MKRHMPLIVVAASFVLMLTLVIVLCGEVLFSKDTVFAFNDGNIEGAITQYKYPESILRCWSNQGFFGISSGVLTLNVNSLFETFFGPFGFRRMGVVVTIMLTAIAGYWTTRQFERSLHASLATSILFLLCGWNFTFPTAGLPVRSLAMMFCVLSLGMMEKARRLQSWLLYAVAGGLLGLSLSETLDVGAIFALACGGYFVLSHWPGRENFSISTISNHGFKLMLYVATCAMIAYQTILIVGGSTLAESGSGGDTKTPEERYAWATQWSLPKAETWSLIACDYHGASSRSSESPYWGGMGRSEGWEQTKQGFRNFRLAGYALGSVPFVFIIYLLVYLIICRKSGQFDEKHRRIILASIAMALICLMLSWGKHFPLYRLFYSLPRMSAIRNPDKWLGPFTVFSGLLFAYGVDAVLYSSKHCSDEMRKRMSSWFITGTLLIPITASISLVYLLAASGVFIGKLQSEGYAKLSETALRNAINSNLTALIISTTCIALLWIFSCRRKTSGEKTRILITLSATILMTIELSRANLPFVIKHPCAYLDHPNPLTDYLDKNRHYGRIKLMPAQDPLINNWRMTYVMAKSYSIFDPVSIREMPADLKLFFDTFSSNPFRLWQIGAIRYFICNPETARQLLAVNSTNQELFVKQLELSVWQSPDGALIPVPASDAARKYVEILEFSASLPMFRFVPGWQNVPNDPDGDKAVLEKMTAPDYNPGAITHIHSDEPAVSGQGSIGNLTLVSSSLPEIVLLTSTSGEGILFRAERHHPDWKVFIDGKQVELLRADYLFQAVKVPAGDHEIRFSFEPSKKPLFLSITGRLALIGLIVIGTVNSRQKKHWNLKKND